jgi:ribosomal protein S18 acetylase RimI-like enzyme
MKWFHLIDRGILMDVRSVFYVGDAWTSILNRKDTKALQELCESCIDYYQLHGEMDVPMNAAEELFDELPPGKTGEDKIVIGLFKAEEEIIGIIETIKGYPDHDCWFIGQMMIDPKYRGQGVGHDFYKGHEAWTYSQGAERLRLGVLQENKRAYQFWQGLGFEKIDTRENYRIKDKVTVVYVMEKKIKRNIGK